MKRLMMILSLLTFALLLSGCAETEEVQEEVELTMITIAGTNDTIVQKNSTFNVLEGVTVTGDDNVDYTSELKVFLNGCGIDEDNNVYTDVPKTCLVTYIAVVDGLYVKEIRELTIR